MTDSTKQNKPRKIPVNNGDSTEISSLIKGKSNGVVQGEKSEEFNSIEKESLEIQKNIDLQEKKEEVLAEQKPEEESKSLEGEVEYYKDLYLRALAEIDNYRKRSAREMERLRNFERETFLREWLPVVDNLERALSSEGAEKNPIFQGIEAIHQQILDILKKFGVEQIIPVDELFNPEWHEAVATVNMPDEKEGEIVEVIQPGYKINGRPLRPVKVIPVKHIKEDFD